MPRTVYHEIYFHITWHTKGSLPVIGPEIEDKLHGFLKHKILDTPEVICHAVGGVEDHIHLAVSIPPSVLPSDWIGKLKGASSHHINQSGNRKLLEWQRGYGIVSFGAKDLPWVVNYVLNQKEHHQRGKTFDRLERTEDEDG